MRLPMIPRIDTTVWMTPAMGFTFCETILSISIKMDSKDFMLGSVDCNLLEIVNKKATCAFCDSIILLKNPHSPLNINYTSPIYLFGSYLFVMILIIHTCIKTLKFLLELYELYILTQSETC